MAVGFLAVVAVVVLWLTDDMTQTWVPWVHHVFMEAGWRVAVGLGVLSLLVERFDSDSALLRRDAVVGVLLGLAAVTLMSALTASTDFSQI